MIINVEDFMIYNMIIIVVSALFLFLAYRKGFMRQLFDVVSLIASYIVSGMLCGAVADIFPIYQISTPVSIINDISTSLINAIIWFVILIRCVSYCILDLVFFDARNLQDQNLIVYQSHAWTCAWCC